MGSVVCCANNKGGIGKTSVTCHLAVALARKGARVLVIDTDPQTNASGILLPKSVLVVNTLYELLDPSGNGTPVKSCVYASEYPGVSVIPNTPETSGLELDLATGYPETLKILRNRVAGHARDAYDVTLIDCPPTVGVFVANALFASDYALIPVDAGSAQSLHGLKKVLDLIASIREAGNPGLSFLKLLINRVDMRTSISAVIVEDIFQRFGKDKVFETQIPVSTAFEQAEYANETVFLRHPASRGAKTYERLAVEFLAAVNGKG